MWVVSLINRHFWRDLATAPRDWAPANLMREIRGHLRGHFTGPDGRYNALQKITYGLVLGVVLPMMIITGLAISPGIEPSAPWLIEGLGGRQSARSLHFLSAWALFAFVVVHLVMIYLIEVGLQVLVCVVQWLQKHSIVKVQLGKIVLMSILLHMVGVNVVESLMENIVKKIVIVRENRLEMNV